MKRERTSVSWIGLTGALALHALAFQAVVFGSSARKPRPPEVLGAGSMTLASDAEPSMTLVFITEENPARSESETEMPLASNGVLPRNPLITIASPDVAATFEITTEDNDLDSTAAVDAGDPQVRAALFGRYMGQVSARIERAWLRPREAFSDAAPIAASHRPSVPEDGVFQCQTRIEQDRHGYVQEVQLLECNGTPAWQRSLVTAIFRASPLSAPPDPLVFANVLTLTFRALPYRAGKSDAGYEPARRAVAQAFTSVQSIAAPVVPIPDSTDASAQPP